MRIVIDLQGAQSGSRYRGIGRYSLALAKAMIRNRGDHEILILLNGQFRDTIDPLRGELAGLLPEENVPLFSPPLADGAAETRGWRMDAAELVREWTIDALAPDAVLLTSLFEGIHKDNSVTSVGRLDTSAKVFVVLYDLIPLFDPAMHLPTAEIRNWYDSKIASLRRADRLLAISDSARREAIERLGFSGDRIVPIYSAAEARFRPAQFSLEERRAILERLGIRRPFVMHASAFEPRKNFEGLVRAFGLLPEAMRREHQLVLVTGHHGNDSETLRVVAEQAGLTPDDLAVLGYVPDSDLIALYSLCTLFVFPSFHEGFGLPPLEAMRCGAAVIGSNATSIPEVIGREDALFDPHSDRSIAAVMERTLGDAAFHQALKAHARRQSQRFSWDRTARLALRAIEAAAPDRSRTPKAQDTSLLLQKIAGIRAGVSPQRQDLVAVANSIRSSESAVSRWRSTADTENAKIAAVASAPTAVRNGGGNRARPLRILIDLQGAQSGSRGRGIGRYSTALAKAIVRNRGNHEILILLNGLFEDTIYSVYQDFAEILPEDNIIVFHVPPSVKGINPEDEWRREAAEFIREWVINALMPDLVLISSLFEGATDDSVTSIRRISSTVKTSVIFYDLIPLLDPKRYLLNAEARSWYFTKIEHLRKADQLLAISESARREVIDALGFRSDRTVPIFSGADERFRNATLSLEDAATNLRRLGVSREFIMHASAFEPRKNFEGLVRAYALLPQHLRENFQLVLVASHGGDVHTLRELARGVGLEPDEVVFLGYISDDNLVMLYSLCSLFVFPSFHEGFGLPALEAMCCGAPVIGSKTTSIPEVVGRVDALFDPHSEKSIAMVIERALIDPDFRRGLKEHAQEWSKQFNWDRSAQLALRALERIAPSHFLSKSPLRGEDVQAQLLRIRTSVSPNRSDLVAVAECISKNEKVILTWVAGREARKSANSSLQAAPPLQDRSENYDIVFVRALYRMFYDREPDLDGFATQIAALKSGYQFHDIVKEFVNSEEFVKRLISQNEPTRMKTYDRMHLEKSGDIEVIPGVNVWGEAERPRIVLLKLDHIGDFIITLDAFCLIRDTWPNGHLTLVCGPWNKSLAEQTGLFDEVLSCEFFPETGADYDVDPTREQGVARYRSLAVGGYDLAIDFRYYRDSRILLSYTDATYRAGYVAKGIALDLALPMGSGHHPDADTKVHNGARAMALAAAVAWTFGEPAGRARSRVLHGRAPRRLFTDDITVGIAPGTGSPIKSWGRERFAELARLLNNRGCYKFVLIGGSRDRFDAEFVATALPGENVLNLAGTLSIADLPPVLAGLDLFIGNDTGTTHMAALMNIPTVCIFPGNSEVSCWRPVGRHVVALHRTVECAPCYLLSIKNCLYHHQCMDISPSLVAAEATALGERLRLEALTTARVQ